MGATGLSGKEQQISSPELIPGDVFKKRVLTGFREMVAERLEGVQLGADFTLGLLADWGKINVLKLSFKTTVDQEPLNTSYIHYPDRNEDVWELAIAHPASKTSDNISSCSPIGEKVMLTHLEGEGEEEVEKQILFIKGEWKKGSILTSPIDLETIEAFDNHQQWLLALLTGLKENDWELDKVRLSVQGKEKPYEYLRNPLDSQRPGKHNLTPE